MSHTRKYKESRATKRADAFVQHEKLEKSGRLKFTNPATIEKKSPPANPEEIKQKHLSSWIKKQMDSDDVAMREVLAQELFRLFISYQPKTRLAYDQVAGFDRFYVLSKRIPGFTPLSELNLDEVNERIMSGELTGFGFVLVMSLFLNETDLKLGNLGIDEYGRIIKIDGDWCFTQLRITGENYDITPDVIKRLPYTATYEAYNWLDLILKKQKNPGSSLATIPLMKSPALRNEINQTILRILLMPEILLRRMIQYYTADSQVTDSLCAFLTNRREQLKKAALQDPSFRAYLKIRATDKAAETFLQELSVFIMTGKQTLFQINETAIIEEYSDNFNHLHDEVHQITQTEKTPEATPTTPKEDEAAKAACKAYLTALASIVTANPFWGKSTGGNIIPGGVDALARQLKGKLLDNMSANELERLVNKCNDIARICVKKSQYQGAQTLYKLLADKRSDITTKITALNDFLEIKVKQADTVKYRKH